MKVKTAADHLVLATYHGATCGRNSTPVKIASWPLDVLCPGARHWNAPTRRRKRRAGTCHQQPTRRADDDRFPKYHESVRGFPAMAQP
jgi:hypothetical protein